MKLVALPAGFVTVTGPRVADAGTTTVILVSDQTTNRAETPLNVTELAPEKWTPLIVTIEPTLPPEEETLMIAGAKRTVKLAPAEDTPDGVVTRIAPLVAGPGTCAVI